MEQMMMSDFALGREYQIKLVVHLVHDLKLLQHARPILRLDDLDLPACQVVYEALTGYYDRYDRLPGLPELVGEIKIIVKNLRGNAQTVINPTEHESLTNVVAQLHNPGVLDPEYYKDQLPDFLRYVRLTRLRAQSEEALSRGVGTDDYVRAVADIGELSTTATDIVLSDAIEDPQPLMTIHDKRRITTGVGALDKFLHGGLGVKELGLLVACPGVGKTNTLINFARGANHAGWRGLCLTLEQPQQELKHRYQGMVAHIEAHHLMKPLPEWPDKELARYKYMLNSHWRGALTFVDLSERKPSIDHIEAAIRKWKEKARREGWEDKAKVVVIDWLDMIKPDRRHMAKDAGDKDWTALVAITEELGRMARKYDVAMWTATQGTKEADGAEVMRMKHVAFAFHKMDFVHVAIGISPCDNRDQLAKIRAGDDKLAQFDKEHKCRRELNYTIMKNRNNPTGAFPLFQGPTLALWTSEMQSNAIDSYAEAMRMDKILGPEKEAV